MSGTEIGSATNTYELLLKLATGGMAEIFLARWRAAGVERYVVLKRVLSRFADNPRFVEMFLDEARLSAQLVHSNIAQVYDIGTSGHSYFYTMEYVHGVTVRALVDHATISMDSVLTIAAGAASGLHHAHEKMGPDGAALGIVHRDISPSNLMITYEGNLKIVDFGIAKATRRLTETQAGEIKGKVAYMSPEQCRGLPVDRRSDLFSLGIVTWEMLTGKRLYQRETRYDQMAAIVREPAPAPSTVRADVPPELDAIVLKMLAKDPADRYANADQLHQALEAEAVRSGSALSTATLGRFVRDNYGRRLEPWLDGKVSVTFKAGDTLSTSGNPTMVPLPATASYAFGTPETERGPSLVRWWPLFAVLGIAAGGTFAWIEMNETVPPKVARAAATPPPTPAPAPAPAPAPPPPPQPIATPIDAAPAPSPEPPTPTLTPTPTPDPLAVCVDGPIGDARQAEQCVVLACRAHDLLHAKRWLPQVAASHRAKVSCLSSSSGHHADKPEKPDKPDKPDCKADPLACQY